MKEKLNFKRKRIVRIEKTNNFKMNMIEIKKVLVIVIFNK
jgi:hypothetical protein